MDEIFAGPQLERVQAMADTLVSAASQTIRPPRRERSRGASGRAAEVLSDLRALGPRQAGIVFGETLGRGGMGLVRLGRQVSMGRDVAIKTTREDRRSERATLDLLREAWITGALEHPNILPIYELGLDEAGAPIILMRRVDGQDWAELMGEAALVAERYGEEDLLEWNLRVLMQVCNALSYAHERDIVHRDLKPSNVMLGAFGEVYLVDWGIAVSVGDDREGRFPLPEAEGEVVGTPAYMAPEMLAGRMAELGPRTDVYLVGAVLYEILYGTAPHRSEGLADYVASVMAGVPALPVAAGAPAELTTICAKAMAADPRERYASAEELRLALAAFLRRRSATRLVEEGEERLAELRARLSEIEERGPARDPDDTDEREAAVQRLFGEARFAFEAALREWADNARAKQQIRELLITMIGEHLDHGELPAATRLLSELDSPSPELLARVEELRASLGEEARERERLEQLGRDLDTRFGQRTRWFVLACLGVFWSLSPLATALWYPVPASYLELGIIPAFMLAILGGFTVWARESLLGTGYNRRVVLTLFATMALQAVLALGMGLSGAAVAGYLAPSFFLWFTVTLMVSASLEPRIWPASVGYLLAYLAVSTGQGQIAAPVDFARFGLVVMSVAHAWLTLTCLVIWRPRSVFRRLR